VKEANLTCAQDLTESQVYGN